jgi:hypothetical protein
MAPAIAYLFMAAGTGLDHSLTSWSVNSIEKYVGLSRGRAGKAIELLRKQGLLKKCGKPLHIGSNILQRRRLVLPARTKRHLAWLPTQLVTGAGNEQTPLDIVREMNDVLALRLLVDAVLTGPGIENLNLDEKAFFRQPPCLRSEVSTGDRLALCGHPKDLRIAERPYNTIGIVYMHGSAIVGAAGLTIRMLGNPPNKFRSDAVPSLASFELPGTSGGPVFAFRPWGIDWVGIVSEVAGPPDYDVIIAPSRFIGDDGKITRPPTML